MTSRSPTTIRVALVITELEVGGAERCLVRVATGLNRARFQPLVISLASPPREPTLIDELRAADVPVEFLRADSLWQVAGARARLRRLLREFDPDVVQAFLFHANVLAAWAAPPSVPVVLGVRVADPSRWRMLVERRAARRARRVVCVSSSVRRFVEGQAGFPPAQNVVIPNSVAIETFAHAAPADLTDCGIPRDRRVLLFLGRLEKQKGVDWLLAMSSELLRRLPSHDLVFVGTGPEAQTIDDFRRGHPDLRIHRLGWRPDVPGLLRRAEILLLPSRWEGMPNVVLEAMAAGRPVLATDVEGVAEVLGDVEEQMVPFGQRELWLRQLVALATDESRRERIGADNQRRARECFSVEAMLAQYEALYQHLVGEEAARAGEGKGEGP